MNTTERLKLATLLVGVILLGYGIRADNEVARLAAILVLVIGVALRVVNLRRQRAGKDE